MGAARAPAPTATAQARGNAGQNAGRNSCFLAARQQPITPSRTMVSSGLTRPGQFPAATVATRPPGMAF